MSTYNSSDIDDLQLDLIKRLGLPKSTYKLTMCFEAGSIATCKCEFYLTGENLKAVKEYEKKQLDEILNKRLTRRIDNEE